MKRTSRADVERVAVRHSIGVETCLAVLALMMAANVQAEPGAQRFASNNLCADQYLLALANPLDIAALSPFAKDPALSFYWRKAAAYPAFRDDVESVLAFAPSRLFASEYTRASTIGLLNRAGIPVEVLPEIVKLNDLPAEIRAVGRIAGSEDAAETAASALETKLAETVNAFSAAGLSALVYDRGGYVETRGSVAGAILDHLGVRNAGDAFGAPGGSVSVEEVIVLNPSLLILKNPARDGDEGSALTAHPVLDKLYPAPARVLLPLPLTICSGPSVTEALRVLHLGIAEFLRSRGAMPDHQAGR